MPVLASSIKCDLSCRYSEQPFISKLGSDSLIRGDFLNAKSLSTISIIAGNLRTIRDNVFEGAENLKLLILDFNFLQMIDKNAFVGQEKLTTLSMKSNLIEFLFDDTFKPLKKLVILDLSSNKLQTISGTLLSSGLLNIFLGFNDLEVVDETFVDNLPSLKTLDLSRNLCVDSKFLLDKNPRSEIKESVKDCITENVHRTKIQNPDKTKLFLPFWDVITINNLKSQLESVKSENSKLRKELEKSRGEIRQLKKEKSSLELNIENVNEQLSSLKLEKNELQTKIQTLEKENQNISTPVENLLITITALEVKNIKLNENLTECQESNQELKKQIGVSSVGKFKSLKRLREN